MQSYYKHPEFNSVTITTPFIRLAKSLSLTIGETAVLAGVVSLYRHYNNGSGKEYSVWVRVPQILDWADVNYSHLSASQRYCAAEAILGKLEKDELIYLSEDRQHVYPGLKVLSLDTSFCGHAWDPTSKERAITRSQEKQYKKNFEMAVNQLIGEDNGL